MLVCVLNGDKNSLTRGGVYYEKTCVSQSVFTAEQSLGGLFALM